MCRASDLVIMVVDSDEHSLEQSCCSLETLGITKEKIICIKTFDDALSALRDNTDIDIVIADFNIEDGKNLGPLLCASIKKRIPGISVILTSKDYCCSVVLESFKNGAEDILDLRREGEIEQLMEKWIYLAKQRVITREIIYGSKQTG